MSSLTLQLLVVLVVVLACSFAPAWLPKATALKPFKPLWSFLSVALVVVAAGLLCSIAAEDFRVFYWSLPLIPFFTVVIPVTHALANYLTRKYPTPKLIKLLDWLERRKR